MNFTPFTRMKSRIDVSKADSDLGYFFDLLLYGEFLTKRIALYLVSTVNEDTERYNTGLSIALIRANAIGDFSKTIEDIVIDPAAQRISSAIREDVVSKGLSIDSENIYCQRLMGRLNREL